LEVGKESEGRVGTQVIFFWYNFVRV